MVGPLAPGEHSLRCYFHSTFWRNAGDATTTVTVTAGDVADMTYEAPTSFAFRSGAWRPTLASELESAGDTPMKLTDSGSLTMWGATAPRLIAPVMELLVGVAMIILSLITESAAVLLSIGMAALAFAAAIANVRWARTRVEVTPTAVRVRNVGSRHNIPTTQVTEVVWAPQQLSMGQTLARWQRWGKASFLKLDDGREIPLDFTRSAPSVLNTSLPMPSLACGRTRSRQLAELLDVEMHDQYVPTAANPNPHGGSLTI